MKHKLTIKYNEDTGNILVTREIGFGFPGGSATVEVKPGESFGSHPFRRLKRWCGTAGHCDREADIVAPNLPTTDIPLDAVVED